ncbi:MAG: NTP transferase domain-containing protein [Ignavibacteriales bacterium]
MQKYDVIILAGGVNSGELRKYAPYESEALIIIGNYPMIYYVYQAVKASPRTANIIISGSADSLREIFKKEENLIFTKSGEDAIESAENAIAVAQTEKVVVLPTDIPFITAEAIDDFIDKCEKEDADFYYSIVGKEVNEARFPGVERTYINLSDGIYTGGNLFMVRKSIVQQALKLGKKMVAQRKNPVAMAKILGVDFLWKFIIRRLSISMAEQRFEKISGLKGRAVISEYAEIGVDVDKPSDLKLAEKYLGGSK